MVAVAENSSPKVALALMVTPASMVSVTPSGTSTMQGMWYTFPAFQVVSKFLSFQVTDLIRTPVGVEAYAKCVSSRGVWRRMTKPFSMDELEARIEAILRRSAALPDTEDEVGEVEVAPRDAGSGGMFLWELLTLEPVEGSDDPVDSGGGNLVCTDW